MTSWRGWIACGVAVVSARAEAQTCTGTASYREGRVQAAVMMENGNDATGLGASLGAGSQKVRGPFVQGSLSRIELDLGETDETMTGVGAEFGYGIELPTSSTSRATVQMCPHLGIAYLRGPDFNGGVLGAIKTRSRALEAGMSFGVMFPSSSGVSLVPSVGISFLAQSITVKQATFPRDSKTSEDYGNVDVALGVVFGRTLTVQPAVAFPFGVAGADPTMRLALAVNFGRGRSP
jgi:opacity protein-like surface antigen